jgi:hypothetical protein
MEKLMTKKTKKVKTKKAKKIKKKEKLVSKWSLKEPLFLDKKDDRYESQLKQLKERGFSDTETWSLFTVIAEFVLPRLERFKEIKGGYPSDLTERKWNIILNKMIFAFEWAIMDGEMTKEYMDLSDKERKANWKKYDEGMDLFAEWFMALWW